MLLYSLHIITHNLYALDLFVLFCNCNVDDLASYYFLLMQLPVTFRNTKSMVSLLVASVH